MATVRKIMTLLWHLGTTFSSPSRYPYVTLKIMGHFCADPHTRGLEYRPLPGHATYQPLGGSLLCCLDDIWQLRSFQFVGGHLGRGIFQPGKQPFSFIYIYFTADVVTYRKALISCTEMISFCYTYKIICYSTFLNPNW